MLFLVFTDKSSSPHLKNLVLVTGRYNYRKPQLVKIQRRTDCVGSSTSRYIYSAFWHQGLGEHQGGNGKKIKEELESQETCFVHREAVSMKPQHYGCLNRPEQVQQ